MLTEVILERRVATIEADAVLQIRVPPFTINYLEGDRDAARADAMRHARMLLEQEFARQIGRLGECVRAEVTFADDKGKETERMLGGGHWVPWDPPPASNEVMPC